jgi:hypothetical protein
MCRTVSCSGAGLGLMGMGAATACWPCVRTRNSNHSRGCLAGAHAALRCVCVPAVLLLELTAALWGSAAGWGGWRWWWCGTACSAGCTAGAAAAPGGLSAPTHHCASRSRHSVMLLLRRVHVTRRLRRVHDPTCKLPRASLESNRRWAARFGTEMSGLQTMCRGV